jgi:hypothetical protein
MRQSWRRWLPGPKHGIARGIVIYGSRGSLHDPDQVADLLSSCRRLRDWAAGHQVSLDDHPGSLAALDHSLDPRRDEAVSWLETEGGLYAGTVLVRSLPQARWHIWPNGHPVIQLPTGQMLDVIALVSGQASTGQLHLAALYADAASGAAH